VASTLHQCLKYHRDGEKKINGNVKLFTKAESHFVDASFFEESVAPKETMLSIISSIGKGGVKNTLQATKDDAPKQQREKEASKQGNTTSLIEQVVKQVIASTSSMPLVLGYIPRSYHKKGELPECTSRSIETKATEKMMELP